MAVTSMAKCTELAASSTNYPAHALNANAQRLV